MRNDILIKRNDNDHTFSTVIKLSYMIIRISLISICKKILEIIRYEFLIITKHQIIIEQI